MFYIIVLYTIYYNLTHVKIKKNSGSFYEKDFFINYMLFINSFTSWL